MMSEFHSQMARSELAVAARGALNGRERTGAARARRGVHQCIFILDVLFVGGKEWLRKSCVKGVS